MRSGKQEWPPAMVEEINQIAGAANVSANRADGLAQRADLNIHAAVAPEMIHRSAAVAPEHARSVGVIHHHDAAEFIGEVAELRKGGDVSVHGKNAVGNQKLVAVPVFRFFQNALAIRHVFVLENFYGGLGEAAAVNNRSMIQFIGDNQILFSQNRGDGAGICGESGLKHDAGFRAFEFGDLLFEFQMDFHGADNGAHRAGADSVLTRGVNGGAAQFGMRGESQIIVRAQIDDLFAIDDGDRFLLALEHAQAVVQPLRFQIFHGVVQILGLRARGGNRQGVSIKPFPSKESGMPGRISIIGQAPRRRGNKSGAWARRNRAKFRETLRARPAKARLAEMVSGSGHWFKKDGEKTRLETASAFDFSELARFLISHRNSIRNAGGVEAGWGGWGWPIGSGVAVEAFIGSPRVGDGLHYNGAFSRSKRCNSVAIRKIDVADFRPLMSSSNFS